MRPVVRGGQPGGYTPDGDLGTAKNSKIWKTFGRTLRVGDATDGVWKAKMYDLKILKKRPLDYDDYDDTADNIYTTLEARYPASGPFLIQQLGLYCCYCEFSSTSYEIDHEVAKRPYIGTIVDWDNLLPTCPLCNRLKSNKPAFNTINALVTNKAVQAEYRQEIRNKYFWPDLYDNTYPEISPWLYVYVKNSWTPTKKITYDLNFTYQGDPINRWFTVTYTNPTDGTVKAYTARVYLWAPNNRTDSDETVELLSLNNVQDVDNDAKYGKITDFRIYKRTEAWFTALRKMRLLKATKTPSDFDAQWDDLIQTAGALGFYTVWVQVLSHWKKGGMSLGRKFITDAQAVFPNTNMGILTHVP